MRSEILAATIFIVVVAVFGYVKIFGYNRADPEQKGEHEEKEVSWIVILVALVLVALLIAWQVHRHTH